MTAGISMYRRARIPYGTWGSSFFPAWQTSPLAEVNIGQFAGEAMGRILSLRGVPQRRLEYMIDLDTGPIITGEKTLDELGAELEKLCAATASGSYRAKAVRLGQEDFIPWKRGVSL